MQLKKAAAPAKTQVGASHNLQACDHVVLRAGCIAQLVLASLELCSLIVLAEASHSAVCTLRGILCMAYKPTACALPLSISAAPLRR